MALDLSRSLPNELEVEAVYLQVSPSPSQATEASEEDDCGA